VITDYRAVPDYLRAMVSWRRATDRGYSIRRETAGLRRCSPALVTRVIQGSRRLTLDRVADFSRVLGLNAEEMRCLRQWVHSDKRRPVSD